MQVLDDINDQLDRQASESASGQVKDSLSTHSIPGLRSSILEHIYFHEPNKLKTLKSEEQMMIILTCLFIPSRYPSSPLHHFT